MNRVFCRGCGQSLHESAPLCPHCGALTHVVQQVNKSQSVAALLCMLLGGVGGHHFYLGPMWMGMVYLVFCWTGIPGCVALIELFMIVFASQENWARKYNQGVLTPPVHGAIKILTVLIPVSLMFWFVVIILAARPY